MFHVKHSKGAAEGHKTNTPLGGLDLSAPVDPRDLPSLRLEMFHVKQELRL